MSLIDPIRSPLRFAEPKRPAARFITDDHAPSDPPESGVDEGLLSRTFHRGFSAGQALSSQQFGSLLPWLVDEFVAANGGGEQARRWAEAFAEFARARAGRLGIDVAYVSEGGGI